MNAKNYEIGFGADALIYAKSIALFGVSGDPNKKNVVGGTGILNNLRRFGYKGKLYPINPKYDSVLGIKCYASIGDVKDKVDLAVVAVGAENVAGILEECGQAGVRCASIITSGFAELMTDEGIEMQNNICEIAAKYDMRLVGPNNLGSYNMNNDMCGSTSTSLLCYDEMPKGSIAWVSQSGAICSSIYGRAMDAAIDIPIVLTTGNECDLESADFIWHLADDKAINVICVYSEAVKNRENFRNACKKALDNNKPVLVFKNGKTPRGSYACMAHTASEAGEIDEYTAFFEECGAIVLDSLDEFYDTANLLDKFSAFGDIENVAVISTSGGSGICITDCMVQAGMKVPDLSEKTKDAVKALIPSFASPRNPIDVTAHILRTIENVAEVGRVLERSGEVDAMILAPTTIAPEASITLAKDFVDIIKASKIPAAVQWYTGSGNMEAIKMIREAGIPVFTEYDSIRRAFMRRKQFFNKVNKHGG